MVETYTYGDLIEILETEAGEFLEFDDGSFVRIDYDSDFSITLYEKLETESGDILEFEDGSEIYAGELESSAILSTTWVCDRCGFAYPKSRTTLIDGLWLCDQCIDEDE